MKKLFLATLGILSAIVALVPANAAVRIFEGHATAYYEIPGYTPPGVPTFYDVAFKATVQLDRFGNAISGFGGGQVGTIEIWNEQGNLIQTYENFPDNKPIFIIFPINNILFQAYYSSAPGYTGYGTVTSVDGRAVPEPVTWALLIAGFGLIGGLARRRRGIARLSPAFS